MAIEKDENEAGNWINGEIEKFDVSIQAWRINERLIEIMEKKIEKVIREI